MSPGPLTPFISNMVPGQTSWPTCFWVEPGQPDIEQTQEQEASRYLVKQAELAGSVWF